MSAVVKKQLKTAREAIGAKDYEAAARSAEDVLSFENSNYNARVFLALAQLNLGQQEESESNYLKAIEHQPKTPLAYQGLLKLLEQTGSWSQFQEHSIQLLHLYNELDDAQKAAETLQRLLEVVRAECPRSEVKNVLELLLPDSFIYPLLSSSLPAPDPTAPLASGIHDVQMLLQSNVGILEDLIQMDEADEAANISRETDKRRMRIGAGKALSAEQTKRAVQADLMSQSSLPQLYNKVLEHPQATDFQRRVAESKLLWHHCTFLVALPASDDVAQTKSELRDKVMALANGMVLIKLPDPKAWEIALDWVNIESVADYDSFILKQLLDVFGPEVPLHQMALAHLVHRNLLEKNADDKDPVPDSEELVQGAVEQSQDSLFCQLVAASFYLDAKEYATVKSITEGALQLLGRIQKEANVDLSKTYRMVSTWLATALVYEDAPIHHRRALKILNDVLAETPENLQCLIGKGRVLSQSEQWQDALIAFDGALAHPSLDEELRLELRSDRAWCLIGLERFEESQKEIKNVIDIVEAEDREVSWAPERRALLWWRLGACYWNMSDEYRIDSHYAYAAFISGLKASPTFAPSFTYLGLYYMDVASPPDLVRGPKCFQKALELDPREDEAAKRLAEVNAASGDWDLVEAIARRVLAALPGRSSLDSTSARVPLASHTTLRYSWAWKAAGMADFKSGKHVQATQSLQHALRGDPNNVGTILWLGISYYGSGKHMAALKTFGRVVQLDPQNWVAYHLAGEIQRSIGMLPAAIKSFIQALELKPSEVGIQVVLAESQLALARQLLRQGYAERGLDTYLDAMKTGCEVLKSPVGHKLASKVIGDAAFDLSQLLQREAPQGHTANELTALAPFLVDFLAGNQLDEKLTGLGDAYSIATLRESVDHDSTALCRQLAASFAKTRLLLEPPDSFTLATAWADLGTVLFKLEQQNNSSGSLRGQKAPVRCLREALKRDPRNPNFWNSLGVVSYDLSPRLCQHALIRASEYDNRSAAPWTNLGIFYLKHEDYHLANKAFLKAQVLDPDWPHVWIGQSCLAALHGDERDRRVLVSHAWMLSNGLLPEADFEHAQLPFEPEMPLYQPPAVSSAVHAIARFNNYRPGTAQASFLEGMLAEKEASWSQAASAFSDAASGFEKEYESTSSEEAASSYVLCKIGEARAQCATGSAAASIEAAEAALALINQEADGSDDPHRAMKLLGQLQLGLGRWHSDDAAGAIQALEESSQMSHAAGSSTFITRSGLLLAKCLANFGGDDGLQEAKNQLLSFITNTETGEPNIEVVTTLAALAIVQRDDELLSAAIQELEALPVDRRVALDPSGEAIRLLVAHHLLQDKADEAIKVLTSALHQDPHSIPVRLQLARLLLDTRAVAEAESLLDDDAGATDEPQHKAEWCLLSSRVAAHHGRDEDASHLAQKTWHLQPSQTSEETIALSSREALTKA